MRMLEAKGHWQIISSSGALDLTFALRARGWVRKRMSKPLRWFGDDEILQVPLVGESLVNPT